MGERMKLCGNPECGEPVHVLRKDRCDTCYRYLKRTGHDRSEAMVIRAGVRYLNAQVATMESHA